MTRKAIALAVVLLLAGLAPATGLIGFCANMPCCYGPAHDDAAISTNNADCCTTITCYEAPSHELTVSTKASSAAVITSAVLPVIAAVAAPHVQRSSFDDLSPPLTTKQRLSTLATLLI